MKRDTGFSCGNTYRPVEMEGELRGYSKIEVNREEVKMGRDRG